MMTYRTTRALKNNSRLPHTVRRTTPLVDRKPAKDPMKLFPYLFQFFSPRLSEADGLVSRTSRPSQNEPSKRLPLFLAFRSPSDQLCVVAMPSCQIGDGREADEPDSAY